jgi:aminopeptidase YwaD
MTPVLLKCVAAALVIFAGPAFAQDRPPLLPEPVVASIASELSGDRAHAAIVEISKHHRTRGSRPFRAAADYIVAKAREAGLEEARVEEFPADGKIFYGTQRSRPPWDAEFAELWEMRREGNEWKRRELVTSWAKQPMSLAQDSESGDVTAELVDVGAGTSDSNYVGKDVRGKLILTSSQPGAVVPLGVAKLGAAGIVSYAQNQRTAWWGENTDLVRWGHLETFEPTKTFGFMISPRLAKGFRDKLAGGERVMLRAVVRAGQRPGNTEIATAMIRGGDRQRAQEEIVFSCHLDHPNPGANDNASGCAANLEVAVTLAKLIKDGRIPRPARTIRFIWPPEIEGTVTILNAKPDWAKRVKAVVHMDMVGGGPETKAVFHVSAGPASLPSFVYDVAQSFGAFVNEQSYRYAATGVAKYPFVADKGGKDPLRAELDEFDMGSDHQVYSDASWGIPAIYLHDWPDRYIHTTWDTPNRIDPTKLERAAFIGAASGYFLSTMGNNDVQQVKRAIEAGTLRRSARMQQRLAGLPEPEAENLRRFNGYYEAAVASSLESFATPSRPPALMHLPRTTPGPVTGDSALMFSRIQLLGPMSVFGYDYLTDKLGAERARGLRLLRYIGLRGSGGDYAYEVLNHARYPRRAIDIRNDVSAIYGPVPLDIVVEYLRALETIGVVRLMR